MITDGFLVIRPIHKHMKMAILIFGRIIWNWFNWVCSSLNSSWLIVTIQISNKDFRQSKYFMSNLQIRFVTIEPSIKTHYTGGTPKSVKRCQNLTTIKESFNACWIYRTSSLSIPSRTNCAMNKARSIAYYVMCEKTHIRGAFWIWCGWWDLSSTGGGIEN